MGDPGTDDTEVAARRLTEAQPLGGLVDLAELLGGESERSRRFLGGLVVGALVGAAIAGAALIRRDTPGRRSGPGRAG